MVWRLVETNRVALAQVSEQADTDMLTGLANRRGLERRLSRLRPLADEGIGIAFMDLDLFKQINDTYGHDAGDELLIQIGERLAALTRAEDVVARIGGDEFIFVGRGRRDEIAALADRLTQAVAGTPFVLTGGVQITASVSVGFSHMASDESDLGEFISRADHAMYQAKHVGKKQDLV